MPNLLGDLIIPTPVYGAMSDIENKYNELGGEQGVLGKATDDMQRCKDGIGYFKSFERGSIFWHPDTGAHEVHGYIGEKYAKLGWERSILGYPISDTLIGHKDSLYEPKYQNFQNGRIIWSNPMQVFGNLREEPHELHGDILNKYIQLREERGYLRFPRTDVSQTKDGIGQYTRFQGGVVFWHPDTKAHEVHGDILDKYVELEGEQGPLGYPTSDRKEDFLAHYNEFQNGTIISYRDTGVHTILQPILDKYNEPGLGWYKSVLGYPTSEQYPISNVAFRQDFQGGTIFNHTDSSIGTHAINGKVYDKYAELGFEQSYLGYPISDVKFYNNGIYECHFQRGSIRYEIGSSLANDIPDLISKPIERMDAGHAYGWGTLTLQSNGVWSLSGHLHEDGFFGDNYTFTATPNFVDESHGSYIFFHKGNIEGFPSNDDRDEDFQIGGFVKGIMEHWDIISKVSVISSLHVSTNAGEAFYKSLFGGIAIVVGALFYYAITADGSWKSHCYPPDPESFSDEPRCVYVKEF